MPQLRWSSFRASIYGRPHPLLRIRQWGVQTSVDGFFVQTSVDGVDFVAPSPISDLDRVQTEIHPGWKSRGRVRDFFFQKLWVGDPMTYKSSCGYTLFLRVSSFTLPYPPTPHCASMGTKLSGPKRSFEIDQVLVETF